MTTNEPPECFYYCDESCFLTEDYMAVAGLAITKQNLPHVRKILAGLTPNMKKTHEIKWQTTRTKNLEIRMAYVDCLLDLVGKRHAHFHIRFSPMKEYQHDGPRKRFDTVSKAYYQLLLHRPARCYGKKYKLRIRPDDGDCTTKLERFAPFIGIDAHGKYQSDKDCIADLICLNSKKEPILQLLDVSLGALTAYRNNRHLDFDTSGAKAKLANYTFDAFKKVGVTDITTNFDDGNRLSIWNVIPKKRNHGGLGW